jgi:anti-anti-sigma factor
MPLSITLSDKEGIQTLELKGRLTLGTEDAFFRDRVEKVLAEGKTRIVVNLNEVTEIDDSGMESLLCAQEKCQEAGGHLVLSNLHPALIQPLTMAKLKASAEVFDAEQEGINSFFPDRRVAPIDISRYVRPVHGEEEESS